MNKKLLLSISVGAIGLSFLVPSYAAAPAKISTVAPAADIAAQVDASVKALEEYLATSESYTQNKMKKVPVEGAVIAVLAAAVVDSDEKDKVSWNAAAADVREAGKMVAASKSYDDAKKGLAAIKEAVGGKAAGAKPEQEWNKLCRLGTVMDTINMRAPKMRAGARKKQLTDAEAAEYSGAATVMAVFALAVHDDTHEVKSKKKEDIDEWQKFAKEFQSQMTAAAAAFKAKDPTKAGDAWKKGNTACNDCHAKFREEK